MSNPFELFENIELTPFSGPSGYDMWLIHNLGSGKETMSDNPPAGTDADAPNLNEEWADELDTEEYRDPIGEDGSDD